MKRKERGRLEGERGKEKKPGTRRREVGEEQIRLEQIY
jgi:hypothetical protein